MPDAEALRHTLRTYADCLSRSDVDGILALFGEAPRVEDPVGSKPVEGRDAVRAFYAGAIQNLRVEITGPIRVAGRECAMPMLASVETPDRTLYMDVIDVMEFDEDGRICSMRAFWNPAEMRPSPEPA